VTDVSRVEGSLGTASLTVTFDRPGVTASAGAFKLTRPGGAAIDVTATPGPTDGPSTYVLTFSGVGVVDGALPEGNYDLRVVAGAVVADAHLMARDHVYSFFVLCGDVNRDRTVNGTDFAILAGSFGKTGQTYAAGDLNGDGSVNGSDFAILAGNFGRSVAPPPAPPIATVARPAPSPSALTTPARTKLTPALKASKRRARGRQEK
jgi:hypothetical protein